MLIALGAAVFTIITFELITDARLGSNTKSDPGRIVEAVTSGVAFLAAGSIVLSKGNVSGVTTGASMWLAAAIGVACGAGDYSIAIMATLLTMFVLAVVAKLQPWLNPASSDVDKVQKPESGRDP